jgi:hypothetical protein
MALRTVALTETGANANRRSVVAALHGALSRSLHAATSLTLFHESLLPHALTPLFRFELGAVPCGASIGHENSPKVESPFHKTRFRLIVKSVKQVAVSEHEVLLVAQALVGGVQATAVGPLLARARRLPGGMGPTSLALLEDILAKGVLRILARGAALPVQQVGDAHAKRAWQRHPTLDLNFSPRSVQIIRWLVRRRLDQLDGPSLDITRLENGDKLLLMLALGLLAEVGLSAPLASQPVVQAQPLCWLAYPDLLAPYGSPPPLESGWSVQPVVVHECLQSFFARRWLLMEQDKGTIVEPRELTALGTAQAAVLDAWFTVVDNAGRRDLAWFVLKAATEVLDGPKDLRRWIGRLDPKTPVSQRSAAARASGSLLQGLATWNRWTEQHGLIRFFDDGYDEAQLLLKMAELAPTQTRELAEAMVSQLSSLDAVISG